MLLTSNYAFAQVKIGVNPTIINPGSILELETADKGLLMPRVPIGNTTTWGLAGTQVAGMYVYNTNTGITSTSTSYPVSPTKTGLYYWDGTGWVAQATVAKASSLIYSGFRAAPVTIAQPNGQIQTTIPNYDPYSSYSAGVFTAPFDGWYVIAHNWYVTFNGPGGIDGTFAVYMNLTRAASGDRSCDYCRTRDHSTRIWLFVCC